MRVRSNCLTSILPHPPCNTRLLAKSDGVADCGCSLEGRCNARGVEDGRKTSLSKLQKRGEFSFPSKWPPRKVYSRRPWCTPLGARKRETLTLQRSKGR